MERALRYPIFSPERRFTSRASIALLCLALGAACSDAEHSTAKPRGGASRPNLLLVSIDTCRADAIGCYDGKTARSTPNLDALAAESVRFENATAPVPITLPSHSTMLTGTNPPYHGVHTNGDYRLGESNVSLAEIAQDAGYDTAAFISAFVLEARFGLDQGFAHYDDDLRDDNGLGMAERKAPAVTDAALRWLEQPREQPFFAFVHYYDPHQTYEPPEPFRPEQITDRLLYDGEVSFTDQHVGRLLQHLRDTGRYDDTMVIITSDHGEMHQEHGERSHGYFVYESVLHVPLIVKPAFPVQPRVVPERVGLVDITPTVCTLLDFPAPEVSHGRDLTPLIEGRDPGEWDRFIYCESITPTLYGASPLMGLVAQRWKYLHSARPELYDLEADPMEANDLALVAEDRAGAMRNKLGSLLAEQQREVSDAHAELDSEAAEKIRALGYAGGAQTDFDLEAAANAEDPKDWIDFAISEDIMLARLRDEKLDEALKLGNELLKRRPNSVRTRLAMSHLTIEMGNYAESLVHSQRVIDSGMESNRAHYAHGLALEMSGDPDGAMDQYRIVVELWPEDLKAQFRLGSLFLRRGDFQAAIKHLERAVEAGEDQAGAHANLGNALLATNRASDAIQHFEAAVRLEPDSPNSHLNLGIALNALQRVDEAEVSFRRALELQPDMPNAHHALGELLFRSGRTDLALDQFWEALRDDPDYVDSHLRAGVLLMNQRSFSDALPHLRRAVELTPESAEANTQLGMALLANGDRAGATHQLDRTVELDDTQVQPLVLLAELLASEADEARRDPARAIELAERAAELCERRVPRALDALAMAYAAAGRFEDATTTATEAIARAEETGASAYADLVRTRLELYRANKPYVAGN